MNRANLPKQLKDFYQQYKKSNKELALILNGFVVIYKEVGVDCPTIRTQDQWQTFLDEPASKPYLSIDPCLNQSVTGHSLLSVIKNQNDELIHRFLDMGFDPFEKSPKAGENALHWALAAGDLSLIQRLVNEFKMSLMQPNGNGLACLKNAFNNSSRRFPEDFMAWLYSMPNLDQIMEANKDTQFFAKMTEYRQNKEKTSEKQTPIFKETKDIRLSMMSLKITNCFSLDFMTQIMAILENKKDSKDDKRTKEMIQTVCQTAVVYSKDDVLKNWIKGLSF